MRVKEVNLATWTLLRAVTLSLLRYVQAENDRLHFDNSWAKAKQPEMCGSKPRDPRSKIAIVNRASPRALAPSVRRIT